MKPKFYKPAGMKQPGQKSRRNRRIASLIREIVSELIVTELNDPRIALVTVTGVDLSADLRFADVRVSVLGDSKQQEACLAAVRRAHGFLQERVSDRLAMRFCPVLRFHLDESVKRSIRLSALIARARAENEDARAERIRRGVEETGEGETEPKDETPTEPA
jgi:ribosome-binding factor A